MPAITERDVRAYVRDRTAADHLVLPDIAFTSEDIAEGMKWCARRYNSLPPFVETAGPTHLPDDTLLFFDGIAASLYEVWHANVSVNDFEFAGGSVTANVQGTLLKNLEGLIKLYGDRFTQAATARKISLNASAGFGQVG